MSHHCGAIHTDAGDKQGATKHYCAESAERLEKTRPAFAQKFRALG